MPPRKELTGQKFNRLTVIEFAEIRRGRAYWLCQCECGKNLIADGHQISSGSTKSCGCWHKDRWHKVITKHGKQNTRTYKIWAGVKKRCTNPNAQNWKYYGGRGIKLAEEWHTFEGFLADMGEAAEGMTIERIDNDGDYCPENCKWATVKEQARNMKTNVLVEWNGEKKTIAEWAEILGMKYTTLKNRLREYGMPVEKAFSLPVRSRKEKAN